MPDDQDAQSGTAAQIAWGQRYIRDRYDAQDQPPQDEVTCSGGITIPTVGAGDGE